MVGMRKGQHVMVHATLSQLSPIAKLYELDEYVLLMGVGYDKNTSLHLADARAAYKSKHMVRYLQLS